MRKTLLSCLYCFSALSIVRAQVSLPKFTRQAQSFLQHYVQDGKVAYDRIKKDSKEIASLYDQIGTMDLTKASDQEKKAFYLNAYNLVVIYQVSKYYPLKSPLDASGFFDKVKHGVAGEELTLNALEIDKLLKTYNDARTHFALACAAKGCPKLASFAYLPQQLETQLEERAKLALNNPYFIRVSKGQKKVEVSKIFDWYKKDFTHGGQSVLSYINQFRQDKIPPEYKIDFYEYDWSLNSM